MHVCLISLKDDFNARSPDWFAAGSWCRAVDFYLLLFVIDNFHQNVSGLEVCKYAVDCKKNSVITVCFRLTTNLMFMKPKIYQKPTVDLMMWVILVYYWIYLRMTSRCFRKRLKRLIFLQNQRASGSNTARLMLRTLVCFRRTIPPLIQNIFIDFSDNITGTRKVGYAIESSEYEMVCHPFIIYLCLRKKNIPYSQPLS